MFPRTGSAYRTISFSGKNNKIIYDMFNLNLEESATKEERYLSFIRIFDSLMDREQDPVSILSNASSALKDAFGFFWCGFYIVKGDELILGPFQGSIACYRIGKGKGVCGTAWKEARTILVPDVEKFPGHIACSSLSRSEIVIPVFAGNEIKCVLDIDSDRTDEFDETDRKYLEKIAQIISETIY